MSYAILELKLHEPPATVHRAGFGMWIVRCTECGHRTRRHPLLSLALEAHNAHVDERAQRLAEGLEAILSTTRQPMLVVA